MGKVEDSGKFDVPRPVNIGWDEGRSPKTRVEELSPEEAAWLEQYREWCMQMGLCTQTVDQDRAWKIIEEAYAAACTPTEQWPMPKVKVWMRSPYGGLYAIALASLISQGDGREILTMVRDEFVMNGTYGTADEDYITDIHAEACKQFLDHVGIASLGDDLTRTFNADLGDVVSTQGARDKFFTALFPRIAREMADHLHNALWGGQELPWVAVYDYATTLGHTYPPDAQRRLDAMMDAANLGWWFPYGEIVVATDRPSRLFVDAQGRPHCADDSAIEYRDGWKLHMWHDVVVPADLIEGRWSAEDILREPNQEVRRAGIEWMGWDQFTRAANLTLVGERVADPGNPGQELALYDGPENLFEEPVRILVCSNGTIERDGHRRAFGITVPAEIDDAVQASAWTYGVSKEAYLLLARRT